MARPFTPAHTDGGNPHHDRLRALVTRIASGDRPAFRTVYAFLAMRVWRDAIRLLPPADSRAVTRSTFVEVWHLAGHHRHHDEGGVHTWIQAVTARHIEDRPRATNGGRPLLSDYDRHTHRELVSLLGSGGTTIRTAPATFTRVVDLVP